MFKKVKMNLNSELKVCKLCEVANKDIFKNTVNARYNNPLCSRKKGRYNENI